MTDAPFRVADTPLLADPPPATSPFRSNLNLTRELAVAAFRLKYADSILGYVWSLIKPLLLFGMLYLFFALFLLRGRTNPAENFPVELLLGIVMWTYFAEATGTSLSAVVVNGEMLRKAFFPRWILPVAASLTAAMTLTVNFILILAIGLPLGWYHIGWESLLIVPLLAELAVLAIGAGLLLSSLYVSYRDLGHVWEVLLQFLFYASAIIFPIALIPKGIQWLALMNPLAQLIQDSRRAVVSPSIGWSSDLNGGHTVVPIVCAAALLCLGVVTFSRLSRRFGERL